MSMYQVSETIHTWQKAQQSYAEMMWSATEVYHRRMWQMMMGRMSAGEATQMVLEKPSTIALAVQKASMAAATGKGGADAALAAVKPFAAKTRSNQKRLRRSS